MSRAAAAPEADDDEDEEDEDEDEDENGVTELVGYLEKPTSSPEERKLLQRRNFPSKVGGKPAWLVPEVLPQLVCDCTREADGGGCCGRPLRFLMQVYASRGRQQPGAFHRALHLFVCTSCQPSRLRAFRAQLPWENPFYSPDPPDAEKILAEPAGDPELAQLVCWDCGLPDCGRSSADDEAEALEEEVPVEHRCVECARRLRNGDGPAMFPERELLVEDACWPEEEEPEAPEAAPPRDEAEEEEEQEPAGFVAKEAANQADAVLEAAQGQGSNEELEEKLREYKQRIKEDPAYALDRSEERVFDEWSKEQGERDDVFSKFRGFANENKGHVVRHAFGGEPLWFCSPGRPNGGPPPCPNCGGPRVFELQVQPQLITLVADGSGRQGEWDLARRLDFGTVCVFVCAASCDAPEGVRYVEEHVVVQAEPREAWLPKGG